MIPYYSFQAPILKHIFSSGNAIEILKKAKKNQSLGKKSKYVMIMLIK